ncbi:hypothetical protein V8E51_014024 [Hyaloscypha variabilis]
MNQGSNSFWKVSSDTAISIAFGLISIAISLLGVWISYLTLRAMNIDTGNGGQPLYEQNQILRHEHTFVIPFAWRRRRVPWVA